LTIMSREQGKEEIERLYEACLDYLKLIVVLTVSTGMRKGEILGL